MSAANYLQFATGYEIYAANAFSIDVLGVMRRGPIGPGAAGESDPNPIQPRRREYLRSEYAKYDDAKLVEKQNEVMRNALARGRRVFALLPANEAERFERRFVAENFTSVVLATWREPVKWTEPATNPQEQRRGGPGGPGGPGFAPGGGGNRRQQDNRGPWMNNLATPRSMRLIEITRK
jgi:hypothetical protein